jgi:hypothetical protein
MRPVMTGRIVYEDLDFLLHLGRPFETETHMDQQQ